MVCFSLAYQNKPRVFTMNKEQLVELLCGVDIFEDLSKEEVREILHDLLERNAEINLRAGKVFYTPRSQTASSSSSSRGGCASTLFALPSSSPSRW